MPSAAALHSTRCFLTLSPIDPDAACTCAVEYVPGDIVQDADGNIWQRIEEFKRYPGEPPHTWTDNTTSTGDHMPVPPLVRLTRDGGQLSVATRPVTIGCLACTGIRCVHAAGCVYDCTARAGCAGDYHRVGCPNAVIGALCQCGGHDIDDRCPYWCSRHGYRWCDECEDCD